MKKTSIKSRILAIVLVMAMALSLFGVTAWAADGSNDDIADMSTSATDNPDAPKTEGEPEVEVQEDKPEQSADENDGSEAPASESEPATPDGGVDEQPEDADNIEDDGAVTVNETEDIEAEANRETSTDEAAAPEAKPETAAPNTDEQDSEDVTVQDDEFVAMTPEWKQYKKFLDAAKAGKTTLDFTYFYKCSDSTKVTVSPAPDDKVDVRIDGKGKPDWQNVGKPDSDGWYIGTVEDCAWDSTGRKIPTELAGYFPLTNQDSSNLALLRSKNLRKLTFGEGITAVDEESLGCANQYGANWTWDYKNTRRKYTGGHYKTASIIELPNSLTEIGDITFNGMNIEKLSGFGSNIQKIGLKAFADSSVPDPFVVSENVHLIKEGSLSVRNNVAIVICGDAELETYAIECNGRNLKGITFKGNTKLHGYSINNCLNSGKVVFEKNLEASSDLTYPHNLDLSGKVKKVKAPAINSDINQLIVKGNAHFDTNSIATLDNAVEYSIRSIEIGGNAVFEDQAFNGKQQLKSLTVGGNATFKGALASPVKVSSEKYYLNFPNLKTVTVGGTVKQQKNTWTHTPYEKNGVKSHGTTKPDGSTTAKLSGTKITAVTFKQDKKNAKKNRTTVKWKKNTKGTGYQLQYTTDKKFKKKIKTITIKKNKTVSTVVKGMKPGKYYFRIRVTGKKSAKSSWSEVKAVTLKAAVKKAAK